MARLITLNFFPSDKQLLLPLTVAGNATLSIRLADPYPFIFAHLARTISFTSPDDLSGTNFTITGTDQFGNIISEVRAGPNNETVETINEYNKIINISADVNYTNLSIGSGSKGTFQWVKLNTFSELGAIIVSADVISEAADPITYSLYATLDNLEYYKTVGATYKYVYPGAPLLLGTDPLTTVNGSNIVTVTVPSTGEMSNGDIVQISGATATNGIPENSLNVKSMITIVDSTHFTYQAGQPATGSGSGGGSSVTYTFPAPPLRFALKNDAGASIENVSADSISKNVAITAVQAVVTASTEGTGLVVNILQQGIN